MSWLLYLTSGVVATVITAHLMTRKSRQSPPPEHPEEKPVPATTTKVEINVNIHPSLCHSWCPFCDASAEDLEQSQKLEDLARRLAALYDASQDEEDEADEDRHLAFARYLVQTGRLTEDI